MGRSREPAPHQAHQVVITPGRSCLISKHAPQTSPSVRRTCPVADLPPNESLPNESLPNESLPSRRIRSVGISPAAPENSQPGPFPSRRHSLYFRTPRPSRLGTHAAGWSSPVAREAHNLEVVGSNPAPAIDFERTPVFAGVFSFPGAPCRPVPSDSAAACVGTCVAPDGSMAAAKWDSVTWREYSAATPGEFPSQSQTTPVASPPRIHGRPPSFMRGKPSTPGPSRPPAAPVDEARASSLLRRRLRRQIPPDQFDDLSPMVLDLPLDVRDVPRMAQASGQELELLGAGGRDGEIAGVAADHP